MERMLAQTGDAARNAVAARTMESVMTELRRTSLFRQLVPMEAGIGWPIPLRREGHVYVTFPLFGFSAKAGQTPLELFAPFAAVTLDWARERPVKFVNFAFERPWTEQPAGPVGTWPHPAIATLTTGEYRERRANLLAMYDELVQSLAGDTALDDAWNASFTALLGELIEPALVPYYRALGEKFFARFLPEGAP